MGILRVIGLFNLVCVASFFLVADAACRSHLRSSGVPKWKSPLGMLRERMGIDRPTAATDSLQGPRLQEWPIDIRPEGPASGLLTEEQPEVGHYAGYYRLNRTHDTRMFYWFFESRGNKSEDPVVLWMTGGPGCASEVALFYENGPWKIHPENLTLHWNDYGWDKVSNIIYVDQPVNTGFSYSSDPRDIRHDEPGISQDVFEFLQDFFEAHPDYQGREFFVTGESYGGHYVPAVSSRVHAGNQAKEGNFINLQGFAIGNGLTQPEIQYAAYADFALQNGLISESAHKSFQRKYAVCNMAVKACGTKGKLSCAAAFVICNTYFQNLFLQSGSGHLNVRHPPPSPALPPPPAPSLLCPPAPARPPPPHHHHHLFTTLLCPLWKIYRERRSPSSLMRRVLSASGLPALALPASHTPAVAADPCATPAA